MSKRHHFGLDFASRIRRTQELIMAQSGVDEFNECLRLILAKYYAELNNLSALPSIAKCNSLLKKHSQEILEILDGDILLQSSEHSFSEIQNVFGTYNLHKADFNALDDAFEILTARSYKSDKGQFFTPRHVVDMCIEAIDPKSDELICDPACGSGAFLKSAHSYMKKNSKKNTNIFGFDYSHRACQIAKLVSLIGANNQIHIMQLDSLALPQRTLLDTNGQTIEQAMGKNFKGFDIIVTNPPFAGDISNEAFITNYELSKIFPKRIERDVLFIERCIELLREGGRLAIVLPDNKISGKGFAGMREWMAKHSEIVGVVSLHRFTFLPYTTQKAAVIFAIKRKASNKIYNSDVNFFKSDLPGKASNGDFIYKKDIDPNLPIYLSLEHDLAEIAKKMKVALCERL